mmetsp:Transcript_15662/g.28104  ORF Transcript_15662/g.28104 Transcript_15662/m.28104 type:complete len:131 (-) Transcript_15662:176-568(-)
MGGGASAKVLQKKEAKTLNQISSDSQDNQVIKGTFKPTTLGCCIRGWKIQKIFVDSQAHKQGIKPEWKLRTINGTRVENDSQKIKELLAKNFAKGKDLVIEFDTSETAKVEEADVDDIQFDFALDDTREL